MRIKYFGRKYYLYFLSNIVFIWLLFDINLMLDNIFGKKEYDRYVVTGEYMQQAILPLAVLGFGLLLK